MNTPSTPKQYALRYALRWLAAALTLIWLTACGEAPAPDSAVPAIAPEQLAAQLESGKAPLVLDVRTPEEFASGHIPDAINIAHDELPARLAELAAARGETLIVTCERGGRAGMAEAALLEAGFENVYDLSGHMSGWREAGLPLAGRGAAPGSQD